MDGSAARERRQAALDAVPSRPRRGVASLYRAAGIIEDRKGWLFRTARGHNGKVAIGQADESARRLAHDTPARRSGRHRGRSAATPSARPGSPPTSPMAARSSTPRKWRRTRARAQPSSTTARRNGSRRTRWRGSGCEGCAIIERECQLDLPEPRYQKYFGDYPFEERIANICLCYSFSSWPTLAPRLLFLI